MDVPMRCLDRSDRTEVEATMMTTALVRNQWYVAATGSEVGQVPLARTVCGEHLVLYRRGDGSVVALRDRCSHRGYPLSAGTVVGDNLQCGYHGLTFDSSGTCVWAPMQDTITSRASIDAFVVHETGPWIWVWIGDHGTVGDRGTVADRRNHGDVDALAVDRVDEHDLPHSDLPHNDDGSRRRSTGQAGASLGRDGNDVGAATPMLAPPHLPWLDDPEWTVVHGMEPLAARYGLLVDNLLDLSHETFLHAGFIGTPEVARTPITTRVDDESGVVHVSRRMASVECPPFYAKSTGLASPIDRWQDIEYHPVGCYILHSRIAPAGVSPAAHGSDPEAAHVKVLYAITPVDRGNTLDFWAVCRDFARDDDSVSDFLAHMNREVVLQDVRALNLLESRLAEEERRGGDGGAPSEVSFTFDRGGRGARRVIAALAAWDGRARMSGACEVSDGGWQPPSDGAGWRGRV
jgi:phenylpropionate dioxygenase-like ring-hydroxylating dioxygenase large terminal subunit